MTGNVPHVDHDPDYPWRIRLLADAIHEVLGVQQAIDIGSGEGMLTARLVELGWDIFGVDGSLEAVRDHIAGVQVYYYDLTCAFIHARRDCVVCTETAEHIPEEHADTVVANVASSAREVIVWSAAPPGQEWPGHVNLKPREWWLEKFERRGWIVDDARTHRLRTQMLAFKAQHWGARENFCILVRRAGPEIRGTL